MKFYWMRDIYELTLQKPLKISINQQYLWIYNGSQTSRFGFFVSVKHSSLKSILISITVHVINKYTSEMIILYVKKSDNDIPHRTCTNVSNMFLNMYELFAYLFQFLLCNVGEMILFVIYNEKVTVYSCLSSVIF